MDRVLYTQWINDVCGDMGKTEFAKHIWHYKKNGRGGKICCNYHRNEVANWLKGTSVPQSLEAFISIAVLDFDKKHSGSNKDILYRNQRYQYVVGKMEKILGQYLYGRNIHDVLLVQICRGVISFQEALELEEKLTETIRQRSLPQEAKINYALQSETRRIEDQFLKIETIDDISQMVEKDLNCFCTGIRTLGERMKKCYEKRKRYKQFIPLADAVSIFAPNYRDSFNRIFTDSGISREWLIDLCVHLRFNREELQYVLKNAHVSLLSDKPQHVEAYYQEEGAEIGSVQWYKNMEKKRPEIFPGHYSVFNDMPVVEKLAAGFLLSLVVQDIYTGVDFPPADYILESFSLYEYGKTAQKKILDLLKDREGKQAGSYHAVDSRLRKMTERWTEYLQSASFNCVTDAAASVYESYVAECSDYFKCPVQDISGRKSREEYQCLYFVGTVLYTVFTGKYFQGSIEEDDLENIKKQFSGTADHWKKIYFFLNHFFITFLGKGKIYQTKDGRFYAVIQGARTGLISLEELREDLWEALSYMCTK